MAQELKKEVSAVRPEVLCIIPTYRRPEFLAKAVRSVLGQTYPSFSLLILDNASGDSTHDVATAFAAQDRRVVYHRHDRNLGARANFLHGLRRVDTPYFCLLSDDDQLLPGFLDSAIAGFADHPDALFSALQTLNTDASGDVWGITGAEWPSGYYRGPQGIDAFCRFGHLIWTGVLFSRSALPDFFNLIERYDVISDLVIELSLALRGPFVVTSTPGAAFCSHGSSMSQTDERRIGNETAAMIDWLVAKSVLSPGDGMKVARAAKDSLCRSTLGLWPRYVIGRDDPEGALAFIEWLRRDLGFDNRRTRSLERILRVMAASPFLFRVFRALCTKRYAHRRRSKVPDRQLAIYRSLLKT